MCEHSLKEATIAVFVASFESAEHLDLGYDWLDAPATARTARREAVVDQRSHVIRLAPADQFDLLRLQPLAERVAIGGETQRADSSILIRLGLRYSWT